jgi:PAS domain S-box-containing protein
MKKFLRITAWVAIGGLFFLGLVLSRLHSYLLFHSLAEIFSIIIACSIFALAWNSRRIIDNGYFVFIGIAYLFIGALDLLHTLSYKGMGVFPEAGPNLPTQLWIAARYMQGLSLVLAPFFLGRKFPARLVFSFYSVVFTFIIASIFVFDLFPNCFLADSGLTPFKKDSEFVISFLFLGAIGLLLRRRKAFDPQVLNFLVVSFTLTIISELTFTLYTDVYGLFNLIGHFLKVIAFYFFYKAIIETGLVTPYRVLFRNLKQSEEDLRHARDELEIHVLERTAELLRANQALQVQIAQRHRTEEALQETGMQYSQVVESSQTGIYIDQDERIVFCNSRFAEIYGFAKEEILGMDFRFLVHPDDRTIVSTWRAKRIRGEPSPPVYEARGLTKNGETIWVSRRNTRIDLRGRPAILGNVVDTTVGKLMEEALRESQKELRLLSFQLMTAQENERKAIAQDLHDSIGQTLAAIKFALERKIHQIGRGEPPPGISIEDILAIVQGGIDETRRIMSNLRPSVLDDLGILATLNWFCREFEKVHPHIRISKESNLEEAEIPDSLKTVIFRVLQEAMNNIAKHSRADLIRLELKREERNLTFSVQDNGVGFDPRTSPRGLGLASMKERVEISGGKFLVHSSRGQGTTLRAIWPIS